MVFSGTAANASLISKRSMSSSVIPALASTFSVAGPGAVSMITGSVPATACITMRARGVRPWDLRVVRRRQDDRGGAVDDTRRVAAVVHVLDAVDLRVRLHAHLVERAVEALEGVEAHLLEATASARRAPRAWCRVEGARRGRARASRRRCAPATMLLSNRPSACASAARCLARRPRSASTSSRAEALQRRDQVGGDALGHQRVPLAEVLVARSEVGRAARRQKRDIDSTPPATTRSWKPARIPIARELRPPAARSRRSG